MRLRQFNSTGIKAFQQYLAACRQNPALSTPVNLLEDDAFSEPIVPPIEIEQQIFKTKADAASYLKNLLTPLDEQEVATNYGLWSWLSLFFFDQVCPPDNGSRAVKADSTYIHDSGTQRGAYLHPLFVSWKILALAPVHNRLFLSGPIYNLDSAVREVMKRLYITRIPCIFEVLDRLYWDEKNGKMKRSATQSNRDRPGSLRHRFPIRIHQMEMTYDLQSLSADKLIELLGREFSQGITTEKVSLAR